jgi:hypothetical protein
VRPVPSFDTGVVSEVVEPRDGFIFVNVKVGRAKRRAVAFTSLIGDVAVGDRVVINTTAVDLKLGTGGHDFVLWNLERTKHKSRSGGHIMKLRYTPWQIDTLTAEAPESKHHETLQEASSLDGMPVVACGLHSQVGPVAAMLKRLDPDLRIAYLMTDGGALPIANSELVRSLKDKNLIDATITCGHAFGGDLECVNVFSGLVTASEVAAADATIVSIGPGIVGTGTLLGHTAMEQGQVISAAGALGGRPVAALRISFADERPRHRGVSRQTLAALRFAAVARCTMAVPDLEIEHLSTVMQDLIGYGLTEMHDVNIVDAWETQEALAQFGLDPTTMGRSVKEDPDFFEAAAAAGLLAGQLIYQTE